MRSKLSLWVAANKGGWLGNPWFGYTSNVSNEPPLRIFDVRFMSVLVATKTVVYFKSTYLVIGGSSGDRSFDMTLVVNTPTNFTN